MGTHTKPRKTYMLLCHWCGNMFEGTKINQKYCNEICRKKGWYSKQPDYKINCLQCGNPFESKNENVKFCSTYCVGEYQRIEAIERAKAFMPRHIFPSRSARHKYLRRKRIRDNFVEHVDINVLIERDKGLCQLCLEPVRLDVHKNHDLAPTRDHIVAISNGGEHSYANSQLAHRLCNNIKNNHTDVKGEDYAKTKQERKGIAPKVANKGRNKQPHRV
jgi:5-methylcytosine-specific restriction endonuclease McrA